MGYIGVITHLLTIDPNFLGHPSNPSPMFESLKDMGPACMGPWESLGVLVYIKGWDPPSFWSAYLDRDQFPPQKWNLWLPGKPINHVMIEPWFHIYDIGSHNPRE